MEILDSYTTDREGNECLIIESISLIRVVYGFYIVLYTRYDIGRWISNPYETRYGNFNKYDEARAYYNELYKQIK